MIDGIVLSVALQAASGGALTPAPPRQVATPTTFAFERPLTHAASADPIPIVQHEQASPIWQASRFSPTQAATAKRFTKTDRVIAIAVGVAGGWLAGGAIGYYSTANVDNPDDDTSGLKGMIIGAPIGAAVGGILGYWLTSR
jgi:hypothetical protein